jgi:hypothetical protein
MRWIWEDVGRIPTRLLQMTGSRCSISTWRSSEYATMVCGGDLRRTPWKSEGFMSHTLQKQPPPFQTHTLIDWGAPHFHKTKNMNKHARKALSVCWLVRFLEAEAQFPQSPNRLWGSSCFSFRVERPEHVADDSSLSNAEVKNAWRCTSTSQDVFMAWRTGTTLPFVDILKTTHFPPCCHLWMHYLIRVWVIFVNNWFIALLSNVIKDYF